MKLRFWIAILVLALARPLGAEDSWEEMPLPATHQGAVISPSVSTVGGRLAMVWAGTDPENDITEPEFFFATFDGSAWSAPRAPYFGDDLGRVRRVVAARSRHALACVFARQPGSSSGALDVMYCYSTDSGWSFTKPILLDSIHGGAGSTLAVGGSDYREPGFVAGWVDESDQVRTVLMDSNVGDHPTGKVVGQTSGGRIQVTGDGQRGYLAAWLNGNSVETVHLKPLTGHPDDILRPVSGASRFALAAGGGRPPVLLAQVSQGGKALLVSLTWSGGGWSAPSQAPLVFPQGSEMRAVQDRQGRLHLLAYDSAANKIFYTRSRPQGGWEPPELALGLDPLMAISGFDMTADDEHLWLVAAQGPRVHLLRRRLP
jgi:hypothetical protein